MCRSRWAGRIAIEDAASSNLGRPQEKGRDGQSDSEGTNRKHNAQAIVHGRDERFVRGSRMVAL